MFIRIKMSHEGMSYMTLENNLWLLEFMCVIVATQLSRL